MYKVFRQNIHIHKRYRQNGDNDVAAIYIEEPLLSKNGIEKPIKLLPANKTIPVGVVALVSGWGLIKVSVYLRWSYGSKYVLFFTLIFVA